MPLFLEILDHDLCATESAFPDDAGLGIVTCWTSDTTGERVRLVDAPDGLESPRADARFVRILCL
jgi:hypothetical protein